MNREQAPEDKTQLQPDKPPVNKRIRGRRLWFYRLVTALSAPVLFLLLLEGGLRLVGYGIPTGFTVRSKVGGKEYIQSNSRFTQQFFSFRGAREVIPFSLPAKKDKDTCRVFVFGESAALGDPDPSTGIWRVLQVMLEDRYPGVRFEVVNAGITAISSHVVLPIVKDCAELEPDVFVVYMGNNEVIGPYGAKTVFASPGSNIASIRASIALKGTRLGQLIDNMSGILPGGKTDPSAKWRGMETFRSVQVSRSDPRLETVYAHFERNIEDIRRVAQEAKIPIVFSTVAVNLSDCPPFGSSHSETLSDEDVKQWENYYEEGISAEKQGRIESALDEYRKAEAIDAEFADLQFRAARCLRRLGNFDESRERYFKALDLDTLRFRAVPRINEIIRRCAEGKSEEGVFFVDSKREIEKESDHGIPGEDFFYDHVHITFPARYVISRALFETIQNALPDWVQSRSSKRPVLSVEECEKRVPYTDWNRWISASVIRDYVKKAPFTGQIDAQERLAIRQKTLDELTQRLARKDVVEKMVERYRTVIRDYDTHWYPHHDYAYVEFKYAKDPVEAEKHWRICIERCPNFRQGYYSLGRALNALGKYEESATVFRKLIDMDPINVSAYLDLSDVLKTLRRDEEAIDLLRRCVRLSPYSDRAHAGLADLLRTIHPKDRHSREEAMAHYLKALELSPDNSEAKQGLGLTYYSAAVERMNLGEWENAKDLLMKSVETYPDNAEAHYDLGVVILQCKGSKEDAAKQFEEALRIDPKHALARSSLGMLKK